jgi:hypothetical protein
LTDLFNGICDLAIFIQTESIVYRTKLGVIVR